VERPAAVLCATAALVLLAVGVWLPWYEERVDVEVGGFLSSTFQERSKILGVVESRSITYVGGVKVVAEESQDIPVELSLLLPSLLGILGAVMAIFGAALSPRIGIAAAAFGAAMALVAGMLLPILTPWSDAFYEHTTEGAVTTTQAPWLGWYLVLIAGVLLVVAVAYLARMPPRLRPTTTTVPPPA